MSDERFRGLLREKRPRLVQAVQVWDDLRSPQVVKDYDHPEIWQRVVFEPREAAWHQERARRKERSGRGGITKLFAAPDDAYEITREQWELHRPAFQLCGGWKTSAGAGTGRRKGSSNPSAARAAANGCRVGGSRPTRPKRRIDCRFGDARNRYPKAREL